MFSYNSQSTLEQIEKAFDSINRIASEKIRSLIRLPLLIPTRQNREYAAVLRLLDEIVFGIIAERRQNQEREPQDLLSVLMSSVDETDQTGMSDLQLRDELMTMFLAGHETTAHTLAWAFDYVMKRPDVEEKLVQEWERVLDGALPGAEHFNELEYGVLSIWGRPSILHRQSFCHAGNGYYTGCNWAIVPTASYKGASSGCSRSAAYVISQRWN